MGRSRGTSAPTMSPEVSSLQTGRARRSSEAAPGAALKLHLARGPTGVTRASVLAWFGAAMPARLTRGGSADRVCGAWHHAPSMPPPLRCPRVSGGDRVLRRLLLRRAHGHDRSGVTGPERRLGQTRQSGHRLAVLDGSDPFERVLRTIGGLAHRVVLAPGGPAGMLLRQGDARVEVGGVAAFEVHSPLLNPPEARATPEHDRRHRQHP